MKRVKKALMAGGFVLGVLLAAFLIGITGVLHPFMPLVVVIVILFFVAYHTIEDF